MPLPIRSPPDKSVNIVNVGNDNDNAIASSPGTNAINHSIIPTALFKSTLSKDTWGSCDDLMFTTPSAAPSIGNPRKRRQLNLSPSDPTINMEHDKVDQILDFVKSSQRKIDQLNSNINKLIDENDELKIEFRKISEFYNVLKSEVTDLKVTNKQLLQKLNCANINLQQHINNAPSNDPQKKDFPNLCAPVASTSSTPILYADALKKPSAAKNPVIVVKPKNAAQKSETTLDIIKSKITPTKLKVKNVKHTANGGIAIECASKEAVENLKSNAESILGQSYTISSSEKRAPRIKVIGLSERKTAETIESDLRTQNEEFFAADSKVVVSDCFEVRSKYGFRVEVDPKTFNRLMMDERKRLRVGWDLCVVYEAFSTIRCYNCWRFHHTAKTCKIAQVCGKCSGNHVSSVCQSNVDKCVNCIETNTKLRLNIDESHPAWSVDCDVYKRKIVLEKKNINYDMNEDMNA